MCSPEGQGRPPSQLRGSRGLKPIPVASRALGLTSCLSKVRAAAQGAKGRDLASGRLTLPVSRSLHSPRVASCRVWPECHPLWLDLPPAWVLEGGPGSVTCHLVLPEPSQWGPSLPGSLRLYPGHTHLIATFILFLSTQFLLGHCKELKLPRKMDARKGTCSPSPSLEMFFFWPC